MSEISKSELDIYPTYTREVDKRLFQILTSDTDPTNPWSRQFGEDRVSLPLETLQERQRQIGDFRNLIILASDIALAKPEQIRDRHFGFRTDEDKGQTIETSAVSIRPSAGTTEPIHQLYLVSRTLLPESIRINNIPAEGLRIDFKLRQRLAEILDRLESSTRRQDPNIVETASAEMTRITMTPIEEQRFEIQSTTNRMGICGIKIIKTLTGIQAFPYTYIGDIRAEISPFFDPNPNKKPEDQLSSPVIPYREYKQSPLFSLSKDLQDKISAVRDIANKRLRR